MGISDYIRKFKDKTISKAKGEYIPVEQLKTKVQTYGETSTREKLADIKSRVKTIISKKQYEKQEKLERETKSMKEELERIKLKNQLSKEKAKLPSTGLRATLEKFNEAQSKIKVKKPGEKRILNDNIFGGKGPFEP